MSGENELLSVKLMKKRDKLVMDIQQIDTLLIQLVYKCKQLSTANDALILASTTNDSSSQEDFERLSKECNDIMEDILSTTDFSDDDVFYVLQKIK